MEEILLHGKFQMLPACSVFYDVTLTRQNLMFVELIDGKQGKLTSLLMENIIGCKLYNSKITQDICHYFKVITLTKNKKNLRQKQTFTFRVGDSDQEVNLSIAENWMRTITWVIESPELPVAEILSKETYPLQKRFFIAINPKSGPGKSLHGFKHTIEPLLIDANVKYEVLITEYPGHLSSIMMNFDYNQWDAIVICSGDGLVYEFINGSMKRPDWQDVLKLPIGILPTGSGNALSTSILFSAKEKYALINAVYVLLKGRSHPMDLFSVISKQHTHYGFLSVSWGIISDIDIESEKFRAIGPLRFTIGALQRILNLRHYMGKFSYLPGKSLKIIEPGIEAKENDCSSSSFEDSSPGSSSHIIHSNDVVLGETISINKEEDLSNVCTNDVCSSSQGNDEDSTVGSNIRLCPSSSDSETTIYGPKCNIPDIDQPLPDHWVTVEEEFISILLSSLSHIGSDNYVSPGMLFDDGIMNLQIIKRGPKTRKLLQVLTLFETGKHIDLPEVECGFIKAFRLEPGMERLGHLVVDGESIDYEAIQGEIHPSLANIIMMPER